MHHHTEVLEKTCCPLCHTPVVHQPQHYYYWSLLHSTILRSRADSLHSHVILHEWIAFYSAFWISTKVVYLQQSHGWCHMKLLPSRHILCTPDNHAPCHFMQSHVHKVYACLAVTCHLRFWQNDRNLLRATAVTQGWNRYQNKCQHWKLTLEKKILLPLQQGFEPATFWYMSGALTTELSLLPNSLALDLSLPFPPTFPPFLGLPSFLPEADPDSLCSLRLAFSWKQQLKHDDY